MSAVLHLVLHLGSDAYALRASDVRRVLPLARLTPLPTAPPEVAGLLDFHGTAVPVLDLVRLALGRDALARHTTRIVLVDHPRPGPRSRLLGLIAERVTDAVKIEPEGFAEHGVGADRAWCPSVASVNGKLVQTVSIADLLTEELAARLFAAPPDGAVHARAIHA
jgi:chemotaxis-related protein WspB